jgi:hypothetical protein
MIGVEIMIVAVAISLVGLVAVWPHFKRLERRAQYDLDHPEQMR